MSSSSWRPGQSGEEGHHAGVLLPLTASMSPASQAMLRGMVIVDLVGAEAVQPRTGAISARPCRLLEQSQSAALESPWCRRSSPGPAPARPSAFPFHQLLDPASLVHSDPEPGTGPAADGSISSVPAKTSTRCRELAAAGGEYRTAAAGPSGASSRLTAAGTAAGLWGRLSPPRSVGLSKLSAATTATNPRRNRLES